MHHHLNQLMVAFYDDGEAAAAASRDLATGGIPEGNIHETSSADPAAIWQWLERNNVTGDRLARLRQSAGAATPLDARAADADVTRVLDVLRRHGARRVEDLGSDYGGTQAGLHPPSAAT